VGRMLRSNERSRRCFVDKGQLRQLDGEHAIAVSKARVEGALQTCFEETLI